MTFYLKYRPKKISELDLRRVRDELSKILSSKDIPHAFLFAGPRGAGKTSAARILAKVVNCENREEGSYEPCNECSQCTAITSGSSLDVVEIDAASNRGVDDIRTLREGVRLAPAGAKKKVYIIDEAHMLTTEASNALLKTLEEPPAHVLFVLATTAPGKLLDTIRSRCVIVTFPKATNEEIVESLKKASKGEGLKVQDEVLEEIAKWTDGSFREAHKILEQVSFGKDEIKKEDLLQIFSAATVDPNILVESLTKSDTKAGLKEIGRLVEDGVDIKQYTLQLLGVLRGVLLAEFDASEKQKFVVEDFGGVGRVREALEIFSQAMSQLSGAVIPQLPLEIAVVKYCENKEVERSGSGSGGKGTREEAKEDLPVIPPVLSSKPVEEEERIIEVKTREKEKETKEVVLEQKEEIVVETRPVSDAELDGTWKEVMKNVKPKNSSVEALLRATRPKSFDGRELVIEVFYRFHKDKIESHPYRSMVEEIAAQVVGSPIRITCMLSSQKQRARDVSNISEEVEEDIVSAAENIFGGKTEIDMPN